MALFPSGYSMGPVRVSPATVLAPMAGVTDTVFRRLIRNQGGCGLLMTEFTSSHGVIAAERHPNRWKSKKFHYLEFDPDERPISAQLFGADPAVLAAAARICQKQGFDAVDINFGCPVKKVVKCNGGSGLLRNMPLVGQILKAVRAAISIPLTVKFRAGWNDQELVHLTMARMAEDIGLQAVALHPRTREQGYAGRADWSRIAATKAAVKIPVIGNGDILTPDDAVRMVAETGCDGIMIGRAASFNPWIFRQISEYLAGRPCFQPTQQDRYAIMRTYFTLLMDHGGLDLIGKMKQFTTCFSHGVRNGARLRTSVYQAREAAAILQQVDRFFDSELRAEAAGVPAAPPASAAPLMMSCDAG